MTQINVPDGKPRQAAGHMEAVCSVTFSLLRPVVQRHAAAECQADLLVMSGYSGSRTREAMFGGVTRLALQSAGLPT